MPKLIVAQSIPCYFEPDTSPFGLANVLFAGRLVRDRFNKLNKYSEVNWIDTVDPIPEALSTPLSELMDKRANELIGKSITAQWSGGVDSTALLLALIKNGISKEDLIIFYDSNSETENPFLFSWLKKNKYQMKFINSWRQELGNTDTDIITNGWCADQLFGSVFFSNFTHKYFEPLDKFLKGFQCPSRNLNDEHRANAIEVYKRNAQELFNIDLKIGAELGWFINFCSKWTWVSTFNELFLLGTKSFRKTKVFYDTQYFQGWSLNNFTNISRTNVYSDPRNYKKELKKYIYSIVPDFEYLNNKTKKPSWNAALNADISKEYKICVKTDKGYEMHSNPLHFPITAPNLYNNSIFTKYRK